MGQLPKVGNSRPPVECFGERLMKKPLALSVLAVAFAASLAGARPTHNTEFKGRYYKPDGDKTEKEFAKKVDVAKCLVCHGKDAEGKKKNEIRNEYGKVIEKLLGKKNEMDKEKIRKALDDAYDTKAAGGSDETYGQRIKAGKLPAGE
jgi:hypothetical protein